MSDCHRICHAIRLIRCFTYDTQYCAAVDTIHCDVREAVRLHAEPGFLIYWDTRDTLAAALGRFAEDS